MTTLEIKSNCQSNDPNNYHPMEVESTLRFPLDSSMRIIFTGYYNGFGVEIKSLDEMTLLYHMGCFGKGSFSRSQPADHNIPKIMRRRQFLKRNHWCRKYNNSQETIDSDIFLKDIDRLAAKIISDGDKELRKDVIDLVSSDENSGENVDDRENADAENDDMENDDIENDFTINSIHNHDKEDLVVIVPNSDSEGDDYFINMKPKCCINKIKLPEKLILTSQESFFLLYGLGCLQIINFDNTVLNIEQCWELFTKSDHYFIEKYVVYHYFRSKGYVVKPGIKFGGDYLLYKEGPGINHSDIIVLIRYCEGNQDWISILGHVRVAASTVKFEGQCCQYSYCSKRYNTINLCVVSTAQDQASSVWHYVVMGRDLPYHQEVLIAEVVKKSEKIYKLPQDLTEYSVREILLSRTIPVTMNNDIE